ncbi:NAD-dependent epimerase/dehydratase family protein [Pseudokineococcus basanitobsidens]|uniref:NAD-dependent epimerase/dehydratase family protein n=1 Tax=Pseudokineococcus basanitobsidens TaxID=1926649 RepID=A0ABU8RKZ4_9ACTN
MRVLVTGAGGFIGRHVLRELAGAGHDLVGLDAWLPAAHGEGATAAGDDLDGVEVVAGDVADPALLDRLLPGVDAVVHLAAMVGMGVDLQDMPQYARHNDLATAVLLAAMDRAGTGRLVLSSSMVVYGEGAYACPEHGPVDPAPRREQDLRAGSFEPPCPVCGRPLVPGVVAEDARLQPRSVYAATKLAQEHLAGAWAAGTGGRAVALRYHNVYGPGMPRDTPYAGVAAIFRSALERGEAPRVFEDGGQRRDFVHVRDVARANALALVAGEAGPGEGGAPGPGALLPVNVASGDPHTVGEMASALSRALDGPEPVVTGQWRAGDVRHVTASPARAEELLGFRAREGFEDGMVELAHAALR